MNDHLKKAREEWLASYADGQVITVPIGYAELRRAVKAILDHLELQQQDMEETRHLLDYCHRVVEHRPYEDALSAEEMKAKMGNQLRIRPCGNCQFWMNQQERGHEETVRGLEHALAQARKETRAWAAQYKFLEERVK